MTNASPKTEGLGWKIRVHWNDFIALFIEAALETALEAALEYAE